MNKRGIHKNLENGLNIYFYPDKNKHSVFINFMVKYGAFHSDFIVDGQAIHMPNGMAHFLEHLLFEKNQFGNFSNVFGRKQMQTNAATYTYWTDYYVDAVEDVSFALEHLIKGISIPVFTPEDIEETKSPIYQEIRMRNDEIGRTIYKSQTRNMLQKYPYIDGLGTIEEVESFNYEQVKLCYDTFYQPKNEILFIAGNFDVSDMFQKIKEIYANLSFVKKDFSYAILEEPKEVLKSYEVLTMPIAKDYINVCYKIDFSKYSRHERRMLSYYLSLFLKANFSTVSSTYKELLSKKVIDAALSYDFNFFNDYLLLNICGYTNEEETFVSRIRAVLEHERTFDEKNFALDLKFEKMVHLCRESSLHGKSRHFWDNYCYYDYDDFDTPEDLQSLNFGDFKVFIESLEFKEYLVTKITDEEK